ncbi:MAG: DUF3592 domain-containing protein [Acidimicrobiia bacterium]
MMFGAIETSTMLLIGAITVVCSVLASWTIQRLVRARNRREPSAWSETTGTIVMSGSAADRRLAFRRGKDRISGRTARSGPRSPNVVYAYSVDGHVYQGTRVKLAGQVRAAGSGNGAVATAERYPAGAAVTVYYDPANPWDATLER